MTISRTAEHSLWQGYKHTFSRLMSDILSPCLDELSVVRDCATDCVSPLWGSLFFFLLYIYSMANESNTRNTTVQKDYKVKLMSL